MKVFVNFPDSTDELEDRLATFHANLMIQKIREQNISDLAKTKMLKLILEYLKDDS